MDALEQLKQWIDGCSRIVFFGGAGVSTESNIPDFRSTDGLYNQQYDCLLYTSMSGNTTLKNACTGPAPKSMAAS